MSNIFWDRVKKKFEERYSQKGSSETENNEVSVRKQGEGDKGSMKIATFAALLNDEVEDMMNRWQNKNK